LAGTSRSRAPAEAGRAGRGGAGATALRPLEKFLLPPELDGSPPPPRDQCLLKAVIDQEAVSAWLAVERPSSDSGDLAATQRSYRKEAERLLLWSVLERRRRCRRNRVRDATVYRGSLPIRLRVGTGQGITSHAPHLCRSSFAHTVKVLSRFVHSSSGRPSVSSCSSRALLNGKVLKNMLDLNGKVVFVAGAGSVAEGWGNGRATAVLMARQGAKVFGTDYSADALAGTTAAMEKERLQGWVPRQADMTRSEDVQSAAEECLDRFGRIDILVNNVGGSAPGTPVSLSVDEWDRQMDRNLKTAFLGCKHVLPVMERQFEKEGKGGAIVNISSIASMSFQVGGRVHVAYAASKAGLEAFSRATAIAYVKKGIRVNTVVVGMMNTPLVGQRLTKQLNASDADELMAKRSSLVPMGRMGEAWDVAHAVLFLASDEAGYITATKLVVDGGVTASRLSPAAS
jgi:NAD(P)-dependent dehydrogenase (short-subunit alcohol dehydrogenase family)